MISYVISILALITSLQAAFTVKQCRFTDDASGAGLRLVECNHLNILNWLNLGYFALNSNFSDN